MKKVLLIAAMALVCVNSFAQKFAHVNTNELIQLCPDMDDVRTKMEAAQKDVYETDQAMWDEFRTKYNTYMQKADSWSAAIRESKNKELQEMQSRIQEFENNAQADLQQQERSLMMPVQKLVKDAIEEIAKKEGVIYVFDVNSFIYFDEKQSIDITPAARKALKIPADRTLESLAAELQARQAQMQ